MSSSFRQACLLVAGMGLVACGCATTGPSASEAMPQKRAKLYRTQAGDQVTLQWASVRGTRYVVTYTPDRSNPNLWRVLPGYDDIVGTGRSAQVVTFTAPRPGRLYYRLSEKATP